MKAELRRADWARDKDRIRAIRHAVFVVEQNVAPALEWDGEDAHCQHVVAVLEGRAVATGRLQPGGKIGRMAVLVEARGQGLGGRILTALVDLAREAGLDRVYLHAQTHALPFYERHGFAAGGAEFDEAGIPHRYMARRTG